MNTQLLTYSGHSIVDITTYLVKNVMIEYLYPHHTQGAREHEVLT